MLRSYEFQGKNVERALQKASDELNIPAEKIRHEVVAYGSSGIFGLVGVKKAKIKVFVEKEKTKTKAKPSDVRVEQQHADISDVAEIAPLDEGILDYGHKCLIQIVDQISSDAKIEGVEKDGKLYFFISGGESGVLIGKRGQTLEAIQYLLEKMVNKKSSNRIRVIVDVEGYLEKRKDNLQQMAKRMAEKAKRTKKPVTIGQMNAHDRRIIHIHLKDESGIRTQSLGDGYYRKLMIFPKKNSRAKRKNSSEKT